MFNKIIFAAVVGVLIFSGVLFLIPLAFTVLIAFLKLDSLKSYLGHFIVDYKLFSTLISILLVGSFLLTIKNSKKAGNDWKAFLLWCFAWIFIGIIFHFAINADFFPEKPAYYAPVKSSEELIADKNRKYNQMFSGLQLNTSLQLFSKKLCTSVDTVELPKPEDPEAISRRGYIDITPKLNHLWLELKPVGSGVLSGFRCTNDQLNKNLFFAGMGSYVSKVDCDKAIVTLIEIDRLGARTESLIDLTNCIKIVN